VTLLFELQVSRKFVQVIGSPNGEIHSLKPRMATTSTTER
jgi:hypothetical protein